MRVRVFGGVVVEHDGAPLGRRPRLVLARLVAGHDRLVTDDQLIDAIWGDDPPPSARTALQGYVSSLRDALEPDRERHTEVPSVVRDLNGYRLDSSAIEIDLVDFEQHAEEALRDGGGAGVTRAERVIELSSSAPFPEFADLPWAREIRRSVSARRAAVLAQHLATVDGTEMLPALWDAHREFLDHERIAVLLMLALYRNGEQRAALGVYADVRRRLAEVAGIDPGPELQAAHRDVLEHRVAPSAPSAAGSGAATPPAASPKVPFSVVPPGRDDDVEIAAQAVLDSGTVTLIGAAGVGKTTCAAAVAEVVARQLGISQRTVDVATVPPGELVQEVARSLGFTTHPLTPLRSLVTSVSGVAPAVLRLETCEVAIDAVRAVLAELDGADGMVTVLTSRVPIGHATERRHRLGPLAVDDAVALLASGRARGLRRGERERLTALAESLDRNPLALTMAAARLDGLGIEGVERAIRAGTLHSSRRDAPDRHASTAAAVEWSLRLLDAEQRDLLERLALLTRPVSHDAVETLAGRAPPEVVATRMSSLIESSLVIRDDGPVPTYRLLDTVRAVVRRTASSEAFDAVVALVLGEMLADMASPDPAQDRRWALDESQSLIAELRRRRDKRVFPLASAAGTVWLDAVELSTLRTAIEPLWADPISTTADPTVRVFLGALMGSAQLQQGDWALARKTMCDVGEIVPDAVDIAGGTSLVRAVIAWLEIDMETAWRHASVALSEMTGSTRFTPSGLITISYLAVWVGKLDEAAACLDRARRLAADQGSVAGESEALLRAAVVEAMSGRLDTASRWARRALSLAETISSGVRRSRAEAVLSLVAWAAGDVDDARRWASAFGRTSCQVHDSAATMLGVPPAAAVAAHDGDLRRAAMLLGWLDSIVEDHEFAHHPGSLGALEDAQEHLASADAVDLRRWRAEGAGLDAIAVGALMAGDQPAADP